MNTETAFHHKPEPDQAERLRRFHHFGDPLAEAAVEDLAAMPAAERDVFVHRALNEGISFLRDGPESWLRLMEQVSHVPFWVDWKTLSRASRTFLRAGALGMFCLGTYVTPLFYALSIGNKPLTFSGGLTNRAARRGRETARFVIETCLPNSLRRDGDGFKITLRVRLMHAQMRRMISRSGKWDYNALGVPINQVYMASMTSLLSAHWMEGLQRMGLRISSQDEDAMMQLWRYSSYLMGVHEELLFASKEEALRFMNMVLSQEPAPDPDAHDLVDALLKAVPEVMGLTGKQAARMHATLEGLAVYLLGPKMSEQLRLKKTLWRYFPMLLRGVVPVWEAAEKLIPVLKKVAQFHGTTLWLQMAEYPPQGGLEMFARGSGPDHTSGTATAPGHP